MDVPSLAPVALSALPAEEAENIGTYPLPSLQKRQLNRRFDIEARIRSEVTALDISAHGAHVLVGFGNGFIICYDMTSSFQRNYDVVGHIQAKGLHTNLLLKLKITSDCRYCFAGVTKGSSEMVAIELGQLPVWGHAQTMCRRQTKSIAECVKSYTHQDPKLRGLGDAVAVLNGSSTSEIASEYRLVCGLGIKNVHIWEFVPPRNNESAPRWSCIFDFATNGNTIECVRFRNFGEEVLSKSTSMNIRVWSLERASIKEGSSIEVITKPSYVDIPNTQDARIIMDGFAYGGTYDLAVVRLDEDCAKNFNSRNRDEFEIPGRSIEDDKGQRRKRMMRQIEEIIGTDDGKHILVLCTDGGVLYFSCSPTIAVDQDSDDRGSVPFQGELLECQSLQRDVALDCAWTVRRVGKFADVVLLRAVTQYCPDGFGTTSIIIKPLSDEFGKQFSQAEESIDQYFYFNSKMIDNVGGVSELETPKMPAVTSKPPKAPSSSTSSSLIPGASIQMGATSSGGKKSGQSSPMPSTPKTPATEDSAAKRARSSTPNKASTTPSITTLPKVTHSSPIDDASRFGSPPNPYKDNEKDSIATAIREKELRVSVPITIGPPPKVRKSVINNTVMPLSAPKEGSEFRLSQFNTHKEHWLSLVEASIVEFPSSLQSSIGFSRQLHRCVIEQDRLKAQFCSEVCRVLSYAVTRSSSTHADIYGSHYDTRVDVISDIGGIVNMYQQLADDVLSRQYLELDCAIQFDRLSGGLTAFDSDVQSEIMLKEAKDYVKSCRFSSIFPTALAFSENVHSLVLNSV